MRIQILGVRIVTLTGLMGTLLLGGTPDVGMAQQAEVAKAGQPSYEQYCAGCHGIEGKGDGVMMNLLTVKPADLTQLNKKITGRSPSGECIE